MLVTCLTAVLGYDKAGDIAMNVLSKGVTSRETAIDLQILSGQRVRQARQT